MKLKFYVLNLSSLELSEFVVFEVTEQVFYFFLNMFTMVIIFLPIQKYLKTFVVHDYIHPITPRSNNIFRETTVREEFLISIKLVGEIQKKQISNIN